jgi:flagellar motor switch protein FliM
VADLSQDEIDALISGAMDDEMGGGDDEGGKATDPSPQPDAAGASSPGLTPIGVPPVKKIKDYDFRKPSPIPEEQKKTIALLHENYAHKLKVDLSALLRSEVEATLENVEQVTFAEYIASLNTPTCITSFDMHPLSGIGLIETNAVIAYAIINRMLGGNGAVPGAVRPFTDVEIAIIRKFVDTLLLDLEEAWKPIVNVSFTPKDIETNPAMIRIIPMKEVSLIITLNIKIADASGLITICIPYSNLEPIAFKLGSPQWNKITGKQSEGVVTALEDNFKNIKLEARAILGTVEFGMAEVLALEVGDIIDLDQRTRDPIILQIAGEDKFKVNPGLVGKHKAVSIHNEIKKE